MKKIGVMGSSFDPPTVGHKSLLDQAVPYFDEILLVPNLAHAFNKKLTPIEDRMNMLALFIQQFQGLGKTKLHISTIEQNLLQNQDTPGPIYTYDVLNALQNEYLMESQVVQIQFIVGPDIADQKIWQKFYRHQEILDRWVLFVVKELTPVHSTQVRNVVKQFQTDPHLLEAQLIPLVGKPIAQYIIDRKLYHDLH